MTKKCPVCSNHLFSYIDGIQKCVSCGLGVTVKTPSQNYAQYHRDNQYFENESLFRNIFLKRLQIIEKLKKPGKILEIGSSTGVMLKLFKDRGWEILGIEPSKKACEIANSRGVKTLNTDFESAHLKDRIFDVVILNHVLEHLKNPKLIFDKCQKVLKEGGLLFIDVPNFGSLSAKIWKSYWPYLLLGEHDWHFTHQSLDKLFTSSGFKEIYWEARSGLWDLGKLSFKKRLIFSYLTIFPDFVITKLKLGTSLTVVGQKL